MAGYIVIVDLLGFALAVIGFNMAFRQRSVRRMLGKPLPPVRHSQNAGDGDPLTYVLRISGVMVMIFGIVIAGMVTIFHLT